MRYFAFTDRFVRKDRAGNVTRLTTLYTVTRNLIEDAGIRKYQYEDAGQSVMRLLEEKKLLPKRAFVRNQFGGYKYLPLYTLREAGIAVVQHI